MTPSQRIYNAAEGLVYNRIPPSVTNTFPAPAPVFGTGNIMQRLLYIDRPMVYTTSAATPAGAYQIVGPRVLAGFNDLSRGLPVNAVPPGRPPMNLVPLPAREF